MTGVVQLSYWDILFSALLVLVSGGVSIYLKLGLERKLAIASLRTVVQLLLVGYVLKMVFDIDSPFALIPVLLLMVLVATRESVIRSSRYLMGADRSAFISLVLAGFLTAYVVTQLIIGVEPWYKPQYIIPLMGMILGNVLTAISLTLDHLLNTLVSRRAEVEMELALGATSWEAAREAIGEAVAKGMIPTINSMMVVGLVSLPGMMTGQILSGTDPAQAVRYQIMVMFMLAAATSLGCIIMSLLVYRRVFNTRHQLRAELILKRAKKK
jgi:putative ABC transport system permease protein